MTVAAGRVNDLKQLRGARTLWFRHATVLTMNPGVPDLLHGDVMVQDGTIVAVGEDLASDPRTAGAVTIDCTGFILCPGLVDAHRHAWQTAFRRLIADADLDSYVASIHGGMALHYTPDDMRIGTQVSVLSALNSGITTVLDFSHNSRSRAHCDAVFEAYAQAGARVVHASAAPNAGEWEEHWPEDLARLRDAYCLGDRGLVTLRMGLDIKRVWPTDRLLAHAREAGLAITFDGVLGPRASDELYDLAQTGALGPDVTLIHCTDLSDYVWQAIVDQGISVTLATTSDQHIGIATGVPPVQRCRDLGLAPSLSTDVEVTLAGDMFTQMRATMATQRMLLASRRFHGEENLPPIMTSRDVLEMATANGALHVGLGGVVGCIAVGFQADVLLLRANALSNLPFNNAVGTVVQGTDTATVDSVFVAGRPRKWAGEMIGIDLTSLTAEIEKSRNRIAAAVGWRLDPLAPPSFSAASEQALRAHVDGTQEAGRLASLAVPNF
ncbi:amidohydrolase [Mycolicibacterium canariasense]|uniref:Amidohydrolase n=2 Tax=Mycolicibacterium canariasense TaxID=228230 RepID=A0A117IBQ3_MYCCR|nr:hypothetical protein AWB94_12580 [Mycolicibacterium canariasense]GAS98329.1 amidohydrolase [Mycolicibacterium canariasense]